MERRLAVHAGGNPQALNGRAVRPWLIGLALVALASSADAKPRRRDARAAFDRGVAAYQKGNFEAASEALGKSFALERDVDTLFAWAQSERKLEHCEKAIDLYEKLLGFALPPANKNAVELKLSECRAIVAQQGPPAAPAPVAAAPVEPAPPEPAPEPAPARVAERMPPVPERPPFVDAPPATRPWYKDPIALGLLGGGAIATGVGASLLVSAHSLDVDSKNAKSYADALSLGDQAKSRGNLGLITTGVGGALVITGVVWIVMHRDSGEQHVVTGWLAPDGGGGFAVAGAF